MARAREDVGLVVWKGSFPAFQLLLAKGPVLLAPQEQEGTTGQSFALAPEPLKPVALAHDGLASRQGAMRRASPAKGLRYWRWIEGESQGGWALPPVVAVY